MAFVRPVNDTWGMDRLLRWNVLPEILYVALGFPLGLLWFVIMVTMLSLSIGLMPILIGIVVLMLTLRVAGLMADVERRMLNGLLGRTIPPAERRAVTGRSEQVVPAWLTLPLLDGSYWRELLFLFVRSVLGVGGFVLVVLFLTFPVGAALAIPMWIFGNLGLASVFFIMAGGLTAVLLGPTILWAYAQLHAVIGQYLLGPSNASLSRRVDQAETRHHQSVSVAELERQRIERDLHDGAQARLSTVALDLGRAKRKLQHGADPGEVADVIDQAHTDAKAAIVELRNLARGIHPAVLTDRGLDAALSEVVTRSTVPVHLSVELAARPSAVIESAAYFTVCELINNINNHSSATNAWVTVRGNAETLSIDVSDDGVGGVDTALGTGISGLQQRIESVDGTIEIDSPLGGGTSAAVELPLSVNSSDDQPGLRST